MSNYKLLYVTCGSKKEAQNIGKALVKNSLVACANIVPNIKSIFKWKNKISSSKEFILLGKTQTKNMKNIFKTIKDKHSYDCPCILFFNIEQGNDVFLKWIKKNS
jgi:periplasmic divalent cation tolerance protein